MTKILSWAASTCVSDFFQHVFGGCPRRSRRSFLTGHAQNPRIARRPRRVLLARLREHARVLPQPVADAHGPLCAQSARRGSFSPRAARAHVWGRARRGAVASVRLHAHERLQPRRLSGPHVPRVPAPRRIYDCIFRQIPEPASDDEVLQEHDDGPADRRLASGLGRFLWDVRPGEHSRRGVLRRELGGLRRRQDHAHRHRTRGV